MAKPHVELSRDLTLFDITMIGVGAMIGAGIFVLTGIAAGTAGPALILSFALNGIATFFTAMVYAELGSAIPEAGGGYLWIKEGLPGPSAFLSGWMSWFAHAVAGSLYALGFGSYLMLVLSELHLSGSGLESELLHKGLAGLIILFFVWINFRGASETGKAGNIVTVLKVLILALFVGSGFLVILRHPHYMDKFQNFTPEGLSGVVNAMGLTFIAFEGYEIIVQAGEEVKNPRRNIPKAVFLSLAIVVPIYIMVAFVAIGAVNPDTNMPTYQWLAEHAELGIAEAARQFMPLGTLLLLIGGLLSTMSALNATTYSSTRVSFAMGRDKNLPDAFAQVHSRTRTPHRALLFSGALILFMAVTIPIEDVAAAADIMFLLLFLQVNLAVIPIRKKYGDKLRYGYLTPFFPVIPILAIVTELFLALFMFNYSPLAWYFAIGWIGAGTLIYYYYARPRESSKGRTPVISETRLISEEAEERQYRVLVAIANPESLSTLLKPAMHAARQHEGSIVLLHVITVPEQLPLSAGRAYIEKSKPLTDQALEMVEKEELSAEVVIRVSHRPAQAIIDTAREKGANLLVMGWRGRSRTPHTVIGKNIDHIFRHINCDVLVIQQIPSAAQRKILVPIIDSQQPLLAIQMAEHLAVGEAVQIDALYVCPLKGESADEEKRLAELQKQIDQFQADHPQFSGSITLRSIRSSNFLQAIAKAAGEYDAVVLEASQDNWFKRHIFGDLPVQIARRVECPVALVRPHTSALGFGLHQILNFWRGEGNAEEVEAGLKERGILQPESEEEAGAPETAVNTPALVGVGLSCLVAIAAMYWGGGGVLTWLGTGVFLIALWLLTWVSIRGARKGSGT